MSAIMCLLPILLVLHPAQDGLDKTKQELLAIDRTFCKVTTEKGIDGWMSFMASDAARLGPIGSKFVTGADNIRQQDSTLFANPQVKLVWEPVHAHAFADGKMGITTGKYRMVEKTADGKETTKSQGAYVTTWRKDATGWKVIFDTGVPEEKK